MNVLSLIGYPLFFIGGLEFILAFILLRRDTTKSSLIKALVAFSIICGSCCLVGAIVYIRASLGLDYDFLYRCSWLGWLCIPAGVQIVYFIQDENSRAGKLAGYILYPIWLTILAITLFTNLSDRGAASLVPYIDRGGPLEIPFRLFGALSIAWIGYKLIRLRQTTTGLKQNQLDYFLLGSIILTIGGALGAGFFLSYSGLGFDPALTGYFSLPWVILTFYAITRYRLFDIQVAVSQGLAFAIIIIMAVLLQVGFFMFLEPQIGSLLSIAVSLPIIGYLVVNVPFAHYIQNQINKLILRNKYEYQAALKKSINALTTILDLDELLDFIISVIQDNLGSQKICIFIKRDDDSYRIRCNSGLDQRDAERYRIQNGIISWINQNKQVFIKEEQEQLLAEEDFNKIYGEIEGIDAKVIIPMFYKNQLYGILTLSDKGSGLQYVQSDIDLLTAMASQAAIAIENARLYKEAITDGLTKIKNHSYFIARLQEEVARCLRHKRSLSLLMIDIDLFKNVNDKHGHLVGDEVLIDIANFIKEQFRACDVVARYGGEEFAILMPDTDGHAAFNKAEVLRQMIEQRRIKDSIKITISIGVDHATGEEKFLSGDIMIQKSDKALYRAKRSGRNKVIAVKSKTLVK